MKFSFALVGVSALLFQSLSISIVSARTTSSPPPQTVVFSDWCTSKDVSLMMTINAKHTVDVLLQVAGTQDCEKAESKLKNLTSLSLANKQISNLLPLASLTNLKTLDLHYSNITNVEKLAHLTNLTTLNLTMNKVVDVKPLANLNKLTTLDLYSNQIRDVTSLASLNKLTTLDLSRNPIEPKVCPLNSASICKFGSI